MSATFWNMRRRKRAELAKQQAPIEAEQVLIEEKKVAKKGVKKKNDK